MLNVKHVNCSLGTLAIWDKVVVIRANNLHRNALGNGGEKWHAF